MKAFNIKNIDDVTSFFQWVLTKVDTFHPDVSFISYISVDTNEQLFSEGECEYLDKVLDTCFEVCEKNKADIYSISNLVANSNSKVITDNYIINELLLVTDTDQYGRSIILKSSGGANTTKNIGISDHQFMAISEVLTYDNPKYPNFDKMSTYEIFMTLLGWDIESLRDWLKANDRNGEYNDTDQCILTKDYAISTIIKQLL